MSMMANDAEPIAWAVLCADDTVVDLYRAPRELTMLNFDRESWDARCLRCPKGTKHQLVPLYTSELIKTVDRWRFVRKLGRE